MANPNGQRGAKAERDLVVWLRANGYPDAVRARGEGSVDRGDIGGIPRTAIQVKNANKPEYVMARLRAAQTGALEQAHGRRPVAVVRLPGVTDPAQWWAATTVQWLPEAGTGRLGNGTVRGGYDLPIDAADVPARCYRYHLEWNIEEHGGALRDGWWITTVSRLFAALPREVAA